MKEELVRERLKLLRSIERVFEGPMIFLGFVWLVLLVIEFVYGLSPSLQYISLGIWGLFIIDFIMKFILAPSKTKFFKKNWLTAISLVIPAIRVFRLVRVLRLFRGLRSIHLIRIVSSLNRSMRSLAATMSRRGFWYVFIFSIIITFAGAAGMLGLEKGNPGFENYGLALWWTAMRVITAGSESFPITPEGRTLAVLIAIYGYAVFGYVTATLATFFIGRDAEEKDAPVAGAKDVAELKHEIASLTRVINEMKNKLDK